MRVEDYFCLLDDLRGMLGREIDLVMVGAVKNRSIAQNIQRRSSRCMPRDERA